MFSLEFLMGLLALGLTFGGALIVSSLTGLDPTWALIGLALLSWGLVALWERRISRSILTPEVQPIRVDWEDRLSDTDFAADGEVTRRSLAAEGLTPETAIGRNFVFETEHEASNGDIWFEGRFVHDGDRVVIRATEPV